MTGEGRPMTEAQFRALYERLRKHVPWGRMTGAGR